jgi:hypothetical protein
VASRREASPPYQVCPCNERYSICIGLNIEDSIEILVRDAFGCFRLLCRTWASCLQGPAKEITCSSGTHLIIGTLSRRKKSTQKSAHIWARRHIAGVPSAKPLTFADPVIAGLNRAPMQPCAFSLIFEISTPCSHAMFHAFVTELPKSWMMPSSICY